MIPILPGFRNLRPTSESPVALSVRPLEQGPSRKGSLRVPTQAMDHWDRTRQDGPLTIRMEQAGDVLVVRVFGELGRSTAETFEFELRVAISGDASTVVLDLGGLGSIDSTGLRSVVRIANQSLRAGRRLRMRRPPASVREALEGSGLEHLLPSVD